MKLQNQFAQFVISGVLGFIVDTAILFAAMALGTGFYIGRVLSFMVAASFTWLFNRSITFAYIAPPRPTVTEWMKYIATMCAGGFVNYVTSAWGYRDFQLIQQFPMLAVALGSMAGLFFNFMSVKLFIYKSGDMA